MASVLIATTSQQGLRPVGTAGDRSYARLTDLIRQRLGASHAGLLAEPVPSPDGSTADWYAEGEAPAVRIEAAEPGERDKATAELQRLRDGIKGLADELASSGLTEDHHLATALRQAIEVPDPSYVYVLDGRPVLVAWSYAKEGISARTDVLQRWIDANRGGNPSRPTPHAAAHLPSMPAPGPLPPGPAPVRTVLSIPVVDVRRPFGWLTALLWLLLFLLLVAITYVLLWGCAIMPGGSWFPGTILDRCPRPAVAAITAPLDQEAERSRTLESLVAQLERDLARREVDCRVDTIRRAAVEQPPVNRPPVERPVTDRPPPSQESAEMDRRVREQGGKQGNLTITLSWDGPADLDLHVICPNGQIAFNARRGCSGGELDVDMNSRESRTNPVENVVWTGPPPQGRYQVNVRMYDRKGDNRPEIPFTVRVVGPDGERIERGVVRMPRQGQTVMEFEVR